jgi:hypothetical protein
MTLTSEPSICIPRTLNIFGWREVKDIFEQFFGRGTIERVDIVRNRVDPTFCKIFVHFRYWPLDAESQAARTHLLDSGTIKVTYDFPKFWRCAASNVSKPERTMAKVAPYLELEDKKSDKATEEVTEEVTEEATEEGEGMVEMTEAMLKDDIVETA